MEQVLLVRETLITVFKRFETIILFVCKLLTGLVVFSTINGIGCPLPQLSGIFSPPYGLPYLLLMALLFAVSPMIACYGLIILNIALQLSGAPGIAVYTTLFMLCVMFFYVRLAPKESALILAMYFAFQFHVPYAVPLIAGLYFSLTSVVPITIGVFIWESAPALGKLLESQSVETISLLDLPILLADSYKAVYEGLKGNDDWIFVAFIFAMVVVVVYAISRADIKYARDLAVLFGGVACAAGFVLSAFLADISIDFLYVLLVTIMSVLLVELIQFFDLALDYRRAERVYFEDEKNFYIVRVIPKIASMRHRKSNRHGESPHVKED